MFFTGKDMEQFIQQKEYIDTAVIPLIELDLSPGGMRQSAASAEYMLSLTALLEKQFKGRLLLLPPVSYSKSADRERMAAELKAETENAGFRHIFYLTADAKWRGMEAFSQLLWLPAVPIENMDQKFRQSVLEDQLRQVLPLFLNEWSASS